VGKHEKQTRTNWIAGMDLFLRIFSDLDQKKMHIINIICLRQVFRSIVLEVETFKYISEKEDQP